MPTANAFPLPQNSPLAGRTVMFLAEKNPLPRYQPFKKRQDLLLALEGRVTDRLSEDLDCLVVGRKREKGRADTLRKAARLQEKGAGLEIIDEEVFDYLTRVPVQGLSFAFAGTFENPGLRLDQGRPLLVVSQFGASVHDQPTPETDYLVIGNRRGPKKTALIRQGEKLISQGARLRVLEEEVFLSLIRNQQDPRRVDSLDGLLLLLPNLWDESRIGKAIAMLKGESFKLFADLQPDRLSGVVRSQSHGGVYACAIENDGGFSCYDDDLYPCMGQLGGLCKHNLLLIIAMVQAGELAPDQAYTWLKAARGEAVRPNSRGHSHEEGSEAQTRREQAALTLLRYKGAEAGEVDWRPMETVPEDYYAF